MYYATHLAAGAALPYIRDNSILLLSMAFCPFAHRVILVLAAKGIQFDVVNCNLDQKPDFLLDRNPNGTVPTIEKDGEVIWESEVICNRLEEWYPDLPLYPDNPNLTAWDREVVAQFSQSFPVFQKITELKGNESSEYFDDLVTAFNDSLAGLTNELESRGTTYFGGNERPGMVDYLCWPWIERSIYLTATDTLVENLPELRDYVINMFKIRIVHDISLLFSRDYPHYVQVLAETGHPQYEFDSA